MLCTVDLTSYLYKAEPQVPSNSRSEAEALTAKPHHHFLGLHPTSHAGPQTQSGNMHLNPTSRVQLWKGNCQHPSGQWGSLRSPATLC